MSFASRAEYDATLAHTEREVATAIAAEPGAPVWPALAQQLAAMRRWAEGRTPTALERRRVQVGVIAARELDPAMPTARGTPAVDRADLAQRLYELQHHFQERL